MREIRFRAWSGSKKKMVEPLTVINPTNSHAGGDILMQYTGLADKNGKEIYEGDILNSKEGSPLLVSWNKRFASFCLDKKGWLHSHWFGESTDPEDCEVIGNIYETPDGCMHPENFRLDNQMPACASCNINKHGMDIEGFRKQIQGFMKHLNEINTQ